jgi:3-dehydroquinate dehydratase-2
MMPIIHVLNGPNLNRLGVREPEIYGSVTLAQIEQGLRDAHPEVELVFRQTNSETQLIDWVHEATDGAAALIINPAAYTFTSIALLDAIKMFKGPVIELHISNVHRRESYYHKSYVSFAATAVMAGFGWRGYAIALDAVLGMLADGRTER